MAKQAKTTSITDSALTDFEGDPAFRFGRDARRLINRFDALEKAKYAARTEPKSSREFYIESEMRQVNDLSYIARDSLTSVKATTAAGTLAQLGEAEKILDVTLRCHSTDDQQEEAKRKLRRLHYSVMSLLGQMLPESIRSEMSVDWCLDPWLDHQWRLNMIGRD